MTKRFTLPRYIKWPLRILIAIMLLISLSLATGIWWLSTDSGQTSVRDTLQNQLSKEMGFNIQMSGLQFQFPLTASIATLSLSDAQGPWLNANNVKVHLIPTPGMQESLVIRHVSVAAIKLLRTPQSPAHTTPTANASERNGMDVSVLGLEVKELSIAPVISGFESELLASFKGKLNWSAASEVLHMQITSSIKSGLPKLESGKLVVKGNVPAKENVVEITSMDFTHPKLHASGSGQLNLETNEIHASIASEKVALEQWLMEIKGEAKIDATIDGTLDQPALHATIHSKNVSYLTHTIADAETKLTGAMREHQWRGDMALKTSEADTAQLDYVWSAPELQLNNINAMYQGSTLAGKISIHTESLLADGTLKADIPAIEKFAAYLPEPVSGKAKIVATLSAPEAAQAAKVAMDLKQLEVRGANITTAHVDMDFADVNTPTPHSVNVTLADATYDDMALSKLSLTANENSQQWHAELDAKGNAKEDFTLHTVGNISNKTANQWDVILSTFSGTYKDIGVSSDDAINIALGDTKQSIAAPKLKIGHGDFSLHAMRENQNIAATLLGNHLTQKEFGLDLPDEFKQALTKFTLKLSGTMQSPEAHLEADVSGVKLHSKSTAATINATAVVKNNRAELHATVKDASLLDSQLNVSMPVNFSLEPFNLSADEQASIQGDAHLALDVSALSNLLLSSAHSLQGAMEGDLTLSGKLEKPLVNGTIQLKGGHYKYLPLSIQLQQVQATITAANQRFTLTEFRAEDSKGHRITAEGNADISSLEALTYTLKLRAKELALINHPNARGSITGDVSLAGNKQAGTMTGTLETDELNIRLPDRFADNVPELNVVETIPKTNEEAPTASSDATAYPINLDMTLKAENKVFVRGWGVDAELQGKLHLTGSLSDPEIEGKLSTIRGRYEEFGKQFKLKTAELVFEGDMPPSPYLNIVASITESGTEIRPVISGPMLEPALKIESTPSLPQEEALSVLLFGKDSTKISAIQAAQLANSLRKLSGKGGSGFDPLGTVKDAIGVDDISINNDSTDASGTSVGVGKYLADGVYLEVERGAQSASGKARIEVEVTPSISVESSTGASGDNSVGVNWKHDY